MEPAVQVVEGGARQALGAVFLLAATMDAAGNMDLPALDEQPGETQARVVFTLDRDGEVLQQRYWVVPSESARDRVVVRRAEREPLDMTVLAEGLTLLYGALTPALFRLAPEAPRQLQWPEEADDRARLRLIYDAFNLYIMAYEEHLI